MASIYAKVVWVKVYLLQWGAVGYMGVILYEKILWRERKKEQGG